MDSLKKWKKGEHIVIGTGASTGTARLGQGIA
jgi:hypothetical protein